MPSFPEHFFLPPVNTVLSEKVLENDFYIDLCLFCFCKGIPTPLPPTSNALNLKDIKYVLFGHFPPNKQHCALQEHGILHRLPSGRLGEATWDMYQATAEQLKAQDFLPDSCEGNLLLQGGKVAVLDGFPIYGPTDGRGEHIAYEDKSVIVEYVSLTLADLLKDGHLPSIVGIASFGEAVYTHFHGVLRLVIREKCKQFLSNKLRTHLISCASRSAVMLITRRSASLLSLLLRCSYNALAVPIFYRQ